MKETKLERILDPESFSRKGYELVPKEEESYTRKDLQGVDDLIILATTSNGKKGFFLFEGKVIGHDYDMMYGGAYLIMLTNCNSESRLPIKTIFYKNIHSVFRKIKD